MLHLKKLRSQIQIQQDRNRNSSIPLDPKFNSRPQYASKDYLMRTPTLKGGAIINRRGVIVCLCNLDTLTHTNGDNSAHFPFHFSTRVYSWFQGYKHSDRNRYVNIEKKRA